MKDIRACVSISSHILQGKESFLMVSHRQMLYRDDAILPVRARNVFNISPLLKKTK